MENLVKDHYACPELAAAIRAGLEKAGKSIQDLTTRDLAPVDQLHTGGAPATLALGKRLGLSPGSKLLDAGCGIGGSSRVLAEKFGFRVEGIDLAQDFIDTARTLTRWCGLDKSDKTSNDVALRFLQGSVLDLPFGNHSFDAVLCQHILMNIKDKAKALDEFHRVLKPGGKLVLHEITEGPGPEPLMPVPWAADASISFVPAWDTLKSEILGAGFELDFFSDETEKAAEGWKKINAIREKKGTSPLSPALVFGKNAEAFGYNLENNFSKKAIECIEAFFIKPV